MLHTDWLTKSTLSLQYTSFFERLFSRGLTGCSLFRTSNLPLYADVKARAKNELTTAFSVLTETATFQEKHSAAVDRCFSAFLYLLLKLGVLGLLCVEFHTEQVGTHSSCRQQHRVLEEVKGGRPPGGVRVDHQLQGEGEKKHEY